jgi:hypothetical protein
MRTEITGEVRRAYRDARETEALWDYSSKIVSVILADALRDTLARAMKAEHKHVSEAWFGRCEKCQRDDAQWIEAADRELRGDKE